MNPIEPQPAITKDLARAWLGRWQAVNELDILDAREPTIEERFAEFAALFDSVPGSAEEDGRLREVEAARARWLRVKERLLSDEPIARL
jgi:hypothetical protein